jgi:hypothetical protein
VNFPDELIMNYWPDKFFSYLGIMKVRQMESKSVILQGLYYFTWITDCYRIGWDVTSDHRSSSNGHVVTDGNTWKNGNTATNPYVITYGDRLCPFLTGITFYRVCAVTCCSVLA